MKIKKLFMIIASVAVSLSCALNAACVTVENGGNTGNPSEGGNGEQQEHTHVWDTFYTTDSQKHWKECSGCDEVDEEGNHEFGNWIVEKEPTETEAGLRYRECSICDYRQEESISPTGHEHVWETTWTSDRDYHWHKCEDCDAVEDGTKAPHTWNDGVVTKPATETDEGVMTYTCTVCDREKTEPIAALGHTHVWEKTWTSDGDYHWHKCEDCDAVEDGTKAPHTWNDGVVTKPATETDEGVMTYTCTVCDREKTEPIPATGHTHNWSQTYLYDPDGHWQTCSGCNETTAPQQHTYGDWIVDKEATQTEQGSRHRECTVCGYEQSETIPMIGSQVTVTYASAASESAAFEWTDSSAAEAKVEYKLSSENSYTVIDDELIRQISQTTARADILGLKGGEKYDFRITDSDGKTAVYTGIEIAAYDRSGYAHFNYIEGVGAYNDDGTLKSGAVIVYVTEDTKNTVQARLNGKTYTGLVNILQNIYRENNPVVIRVLGQISAATWNQIEYNADKKYNSSNKIPESKVVDINGKPLPGQRMEQDDILKGGYNTLDTSKYSELEGLTNRITYSGGEFDSRYNDCSISDAQNVTFEGVGEDAEIFQWGMTWSNCTSIEVRNLTFDDYTEDACSFQGSANATSASGFDTQRVWFHHNTVNQGMNYWDVSAEQDKHEGDGGTDLTRVSYATLSYNHYYNCHKTGLVGGSNANTAANITFHHNWYEDCNSRLPLARQANMHMYNNYYDGSTGTNMSLRAGAFAFIENCYFDNANHPIQTTAAENRDAFAKVYNCIFVGDNIESEYNVTVVNNRSQAVGNTDNFLGEDYYYFDTNSSVFYYDDTNERSDVEEMLETSEIPTVIPQVAGSLKRNSNITETPEQGGGTVTPPEQGEGEESGSGFTATVSVDGSTIVESNSADLTFESGITTGETNKYSVSNDRIYLGGNAAYIKLTFNAAAGQSIELVVNAAAGSSSGIKIVGTNATISGNSSYALSDTATDCVFNLTADSDGSVTITITRSEPSSTYVYSVSVTVD